MFFQCFACLNENILIKLPPLDVTFFTMYSWIVDFRGKHLFEFILKVYCDDYK